VIDEKARLEALDLAGCPGGRGSGDNAVYEPGPEGVEEVTAKLALGSVWTCSVAR